jgi:hypothetical protein
MCDHTAAINQRINDGNLLKDTLKLIGISIFAVFQFDTAYGGR